MQVQPLQRIVAAFEHHRRTPQRLRALRIPLPFAVTDDPKARPTRDLLPLIDAELQALTLSMGLREQRMQN